jgi:hypothetical protein
MSIVKKLNNSSNDANTSEEEHRTKVLYFRHQIEFIQRIISVCHNENDFFSPEMKDFVMSLVSFIITEKPKLIDGNMIISIISMCNSKDTIKAVGRETIKVVLTDCLKQIDNFVADIKLRNSKEVFLYIVDGYTISQPFSRFLFNEALLVQSAVKVGAKQIEAFGEYDVIEFKNKLKLLLDDKLLENKALFIPIEETITDKLSVLYNIFSYCGNCNITTSIMHATIKSGTPLIDSLANFECGTFENLDGTLGGILQYDSSFYAITAGHCLLAEYGTEINNPNVIANWNDDKDIAFIKLKEYSVSNGRVIRNVIASDPNPSLYFHSIENTNFPFIPIGSLEPGVTIHKYGKDTGFTYGIYEGIKTVRTKTITGRVITRNNVAVITALSDNGFAEGGDSGSIYYAVRGSFRYPVAVHNGEGYEIVKIKDLEVFSANQISKPVHFGTSLVNAINANRWALLNCQWPSNWQDM